MKKFRYILTFLLFACAINESFAQADCDEYLCSVDSVKKALPQTKKTKTDTAKTDTTKTKKPTFKFTGNPALTLTQTAFSHWAAGGANSISGVASVGLKLLYKETNFTWETTLDMAYGLTRQDGEYMKNNDKLDFLTKFGLKSSKKWYYSMMFQVKSQFDKGYKSYPPEDKAAYTSKFMAPGYLISSIGMDYKPVDELSFVFSPVTAKCTFVLDTMLSNQAAYGVKKGRKSLSELGTLFRATYSKKMKSGTTINSNFEMFSSWLNQPENIDVSFEFDMNVKINKWFSSRFYTKFLYDDDTKIKDKDTGEEIGPRLQFKQILGVGVAVSF